MKNAWKVLLAAWLGAGTVFAAEPSSDWTGWWIYAEPLTDEWVRNPPPLRPERLAQRAAAMRDEAPADPMRYCRPPQFTGFSEGFVGAIEFLSTPGRVTIAGESGFLRRIYIGAAARPDEMEPTNMGFSTGHWEGSTLVVETNSIIPNARYPHSGHGNMPIGRNARIIEHIRLISPDELEFRIRTVAPDVLKGPDERTRVYRRRADDGFARDATLCVEHDRAIDPATGKQRFDMTSPAGLPPPPGLR